MRFCAEFVTMLAVPAVIAAAVFVTKRLPERAYAFFYSLGGEGFAEVALGASGEGLDYAGFAASAGEHDYWHAFGGWDGGESFEELEAVHYGHVDVAEDDVERAFLNFDEGFGAVAGFADFA